jgi:pyruvate dehydrogenase E1 component beta subunit
MRELQFREALREAMNEEMRRDERVFLLGEEVAEYNGAYKVSQGMLAEFGPKRIIDTPIAELGFAGIAVGAAMNGLRPICEFMTFNFSLVAIDQVINSAAKTNSMSNGQYTCPMVFRGPTGSAGQLAQQHSQNFENWYANTPGLKVVVPSNPADAKGLLKSAIRDDNPVIFMESEQMYGLKGMVPEEEYLLELGKAHVVKEGSDVTIVSFGKMMLRAITAVEELAKEGWPLASISSEISHIVQRRAFDYLDAPVHRVTSQDTTLPYAGVFVDAYLPSVERTVKAAKAVLYKQ